SSWSTPSSAPERPMFIAIAPRKPAITNAGTMFVRKARTQRRSAMPSRQKIPMRDRPKSADTEGSSSHAGDRPGGGGPDALGGVVGGDGTRNSERVLSVTAFWE